MENYLNTLNQLEKCMKGYSKEEVYKMTPDQEKRMCINEKHDLSKLIFNEDLTTKTLIAERLRIISEKKEERFAIRRKLVDN